MARTGWQPQHLVAETTDGTVLGAVPCYLKSHSRGEYVFDRGWAEAYERAGGGYYPSCRSRCRSRPRPAGGCWSPPGRSAEQVREGLTAGLIELCRCARPRRSMSPSCRKPEWRLLGEHGFLHRTDQQFHWENHGYATFDAFLAALSARKRKTIRRERRERARPRHHRALAHRQGPDREAPGTPSSSSTWRPARANGAGRTSPASSTR